MDQGGGFSVLDGAALVGGAAIASIHVLGIRRADLAGPGWIMIALHLFVDRHDGVRAHSFIWAADSSEDCPIIPKSATGSGRCSGFLGSLPHFFNRLHPVLSRDTILCSQRL